MRLAVSVVLVFIVELCAKADDWTLPKARIYASENEEFQFSVVPDKDKHIGFCKGTLSTGGFSRKEIWSRFLANNVAPVDAFVSNSGRFVITRDEWHALGRLPLVIYGKTGEIVKVLNLEYLTNAVGADQTSSTLDRNWAQHALFFFGPDDNTLLVRFKSGKLICIMLITGWVFDLDASTSRSKMNQLLKDFAAGKVREKCLQLLRSGVPEGTTTGAIIAGQERITNGVPLLLPLLRDNSNFTRNTPTGSSQKVYYVRTAARDALKALGVTYAEPIVEEPEARP